MKLLDQVTLGVVVKARITVVVLDANFQAKQEAGAKFWQRVSKPYKFDGGVSHLFFVEIYWCLGASSKIVTIGLKFRQVSANQICRKASTVEPVKENR